jgi:hypothetical protein
VFFSDIQGRNALGDQLDAISGLLGAIGVYLTDDWAADHSGGNAAFCASGGICLG